jgi:quercetin dioxygenase-like cupin family protein
MKLAFVMALTVFAVPALAQSAGKTEVFTSAEVHGQLAQLVDQAKAMGISGSVLADYGTHALKLSAMTTNGSAEMHAHFDDVILITEGKATVITGGTIIDAHTVSDGETKGSGIQNGIVQTVSAGDMIHIPAGTPHQFLIAPGTTYSALVIKVRE